MNLQATTNRAHACLQQALPHIKEARKLLADALGVDVDERPEIPLAGDDHDRWQAVRLMQNVCSAHLHVTDCFGS